MGSQRWIRTSLPSTQVKALSEISYCFWMLLEILENIAIKLQWLCGHEGFFVQRIVKFVSAWLLPKGKGCSPIVSCIPSWSMGSRNTSWAFVRSREMKQLSSARIPPQKMRHAEHIHTFHIKLASTLSRTFA